MSRYDVLSKWACDLIKLNKPEISDEQYRDKIRDRLKTCQDMSYYNKYYIDIKKLLLLQLKLIEKN